jgi:UDP-N-acetylmuramate dehydrogenase
VGGPAARLVEATSEDALVEAVREADQAGVPVLLVAGGSNLLVSDDGFVGTVVLVRTEGVSVEDDTSCGGVTVRVQAGHRWDDLVAQAVTEGWVGVEALSGIPGSTGATPIQNVGAYGQEVAQTLARVRTYDRVEQRIQTFAAGDCGFGYRTSRFKGQDRFVVLAVEFQFVTGDLSAPVGYDELARTLGVATGERAPLVQVRDAVLALRRGKGMVLDPDDPDTRSAGSFFVNPVLAEADAARLPGDAPRWAAGEGRVKTSAAWLIERAGFARGAGDGPARLSSKHTLALVNAGGATAADLVALASQVRAQVHRRFGVVLEPEPRLVGVALDPLDDQARLHDGALHDGALHDGAAARAHDPVEDR